MSEPRGVVAAVLPGDRPGELLVFRRSRGSHAGLWEFPGGGVEPGESDQVALARELDEELSLTVEVSGEPDFEWTSSTGPPLAFRFYRCRVLDGRPELRVHDRMRSLAGSDLLCVPLSPPDEAFVRQCLQ